MALLVIPQNLAIFSLPTPASWRVQPIRIAAVARSVLTRDVAFTTAQNDGYRMFNAGTAFALSLLATMLWASDLLLDPAAAAHTVGLRLLFPLIAAPYAIAALANRSSETLGALWLGGLVAAETVYALIVAQLGTHATIGCTGYLFFLLPSFLMAASMSIRINLLALVVVADWPLLLSAAGAAGELDWASYCVTIWPSAWLAAWAACAFTYVQRTSFECQKRLEVAARTDSLTGAANRAHFREAVAHTANLTQRYGSCFALIMTDIDHFKRVNDTYGHATGDMAIRHVVGICRQVVREVDLVGRLGGEEFGILLPETTEQGAMKVAQRIRGLLHQQRCRSDEDDELQVTCSFGIAAAQGFEEPDDLLRRADRALYRAKSLGRDRAELDETRSAGCGSPYHLAFW